MISLRNRICDNLSTSCFTSHTLSHFPPNYRLSGPPPPLSRVIGSLLSKQTNPHGQSANQHKKTLLSSCFPALFGFLCSENWTFNPAGLKHRSVEILHWCLPDAPLDVCSVRKMKEKSSTLTCSSTCGHREAVEYSRNRPADLRLHHMYSVVFHVFEDK